MICLLVVSVICIGFLIHSLIYECPDIVEGVLSIVLTVFAVVVINLVVLSITSTLVSSSYVKVTQSELVALQDSNSNSRNFFLGTGGTKGSINYTYITKENDEMKMNSLNVEVASLIYSPDPRIEKYEKYFDNKVIRFIFGDQPLYTDTTYKLYIPEGTIKENYNVDLQ
ncbi:hypothetical protein [Paenibacillus sp. Marseille-Q4541]|uniref:hypothetical protein n=1 Tax=Paenibacillus sp. Marseille-Q4541 TaxID=2831522 RepID=UPI001BAD96EA|nr:hypothetical protein [Paenibacillus sp. Marseille-Q4541]